MGVRQPRRRIHRTAPHRRHHLHDERSNKEIRKSFPLTKLHDEYRMTLDEFLKRFEYLAEAVETVDDAARNVFKLAAFS
jgi:hypothetical protein